MTYAESSDEENNDISAVKSSGMYLLFVLTAKRVESTRILMNFFIIRQAPSVGQSR